MKALYTLALAVAALASEGCATSRVNITPAMTAPTKQEASEILRTHSSRVGYLRNRALRQTDTQRLRPLAAVYAGIGEVEKLNDGFRVNIPEGTSMATDDYEAALERVLNDADQNRDNIITFPEIVWLTKNIYHNIKEGRSADYIPPREEMPAVAKAHPKASSKSSGFKHDKRMAAKPTVAADATEQYKKQAAFVQKSHLKTYQDGYLILENNKNTLMTIAGIYAGTVKIENRDGKFYAQKRANARIPESFRLKALQDADSIRDRIITPMELRKLVLDVYNQSAKGLVVRGPTETQNIGRDLVARVQKEERSEQRPPAPAVKRTATKQKALISKEEKERREKRKLKRGWRNFYFSKNRKR